MQAIDTSMYLKLRSLGRQLELEVVASIFIIAASSFLFLKLVSEVREGETRAVDEAILLALRDPANPSNPIGPPWVEVMFRDLTSLGSPSVLALVTVVAVGYLWLERERGTALFVILAIAGGAALEMLLTRPASNFACPQSLPTLSRAIGTLSVARWRSPTTATNADCKSGAIPATRML